MRTIFQCEPAYESSLRAAGLLDFDALMRVKGGPPTSVHSHRETIPVEIPVEGMPQKFYLKRVFKVPPRHAVAPLFRRRPNWSQPRREWEILGKLTEAGIPAMTRVAYGERRRLGLPVQAFLLVESVPMPFTLENWLVPGFPQATEITQRQRHCLAHSLGQFLQKLHGAGFRWPDIHPKHIFAEPSAEADSIHGWRFCLIDVERMIKCPSIPGINITDTGALNDGDALNDLQRFTLGLRPLSITRNDMRRFWAGYCKGFQRDQHLSTSKTRNSGQPMPEIIRTAARPRLPDDFEHPRAVSLQRFQQIFVDPRVVPYFTQLGWRSLADVFAYCRGQDLHKPGLDAFRERIRIPSAEGNGIAKAYYLKRYDRPPLAEQFRRIREFRGTDSSAAREVYFIKRLGQIGVPSLRSIAYGQEMNGVWERRSFGLTAALDGESLEKLFDRWKANPESAPRPRERQEIIRQLALSVRLMHAHELFHRDLYLAHVFLTRNSDGQIVLRLIDLARMIEHPWNPHRWTIKDLAALAYSSPSPPVTKADRIRFLYHYLGDRAVSDKKFVVLRYLGEIATRARRIARHDRRRAARFSAKVRL